MYSEYHRFSVSRSMRVGKRPNLGGCFVITYVTLFFGTTCVFFVTTSKIIVFWLSDL